MLDPILNLNLLPGYLKDGTIASDLCLMVKTGMVGGGQDLHWQTTSVLWVLIDSPIDPHNLTDTHGLKLFRRHKNTVINDEIVLGT
jgi:hypothetical protein